MPITSVATWRRTSWRPISGDRAPRASSSSTTPASTGATGRTTLNMKMASPSTAARASQGRPGLATAVAPAPRLLDQWCLAALQEAAGDDQTLHLARPLPDALDAQLAIEPLGHVLAHVAAAAEDLDGAVGDAVGHLRGVELGHRALGVAHLGVPA